MTRLVPLASWLFPLDCSLRLCTTFERFCFAIQTADETSPTFRNPAYLQLVAFQFHLPQMCRCWCLFANRNGTIHLGPPSLSTLCGKSVHMSNVLCFDVHSVLLDLRSCCSGYFGFCPWFLVLSTLSKASFIIIHLHRSSSIVIFLYKGTTQILCMSF